MPSEREDAVGCTRHIAILVGVAIAGLAPLSATTAAAASGSSVRGSAQAAKGGLRVVTTIRVGKSPNEVAADPETDTIYVTNSGSATVSVISGLTDTVTAKIHAGPDASRVAADPATDTVYETNNGGDTVMVISGRTNTVTAKIGVGEGPVGIAVVPKTSRVYEANIIGGRVWVLAPCSG
jgi:YVTN family beta-propeller protein